MAQNYLEEASRRLSDVNFQMAAGAEETAQQVQVLSSNSEYITQDVNTVSSAAVELADSIQQISSNIKTVTLDVQVFRKFVQIQGGKNF